VRRATTDADSALWADDIAPEEAVVVAVNPAAPSTANASGAAPSPWDAFSDGDAESAVHEPEQLRLF
jgi:hypothetical protein